MCDVLTASQRSRCMSHIKGKDTKLELAVRSWLFSNGYRYRLHKKDLPGRPDIVLKRFNTVIFINGCFWHMHMGCHLSVLPKSNIEFWKHKLESNKARDRRNIELLEANHWKVITLWECDIESGKFINVLRKILGTID